MNFTMATPALLFPAVSLMLLVYANRFLTVAALIRDLHAAYQAEPDRGRAQHLGARTARATICWGGRSTTPTGLEHRPRALRGFDRTRSGWSRRVASDRLARRDSYRSWCRSR